MPGEIKENKNMSRKSFNKGYMSENQRDRAQLLTNKALQTATSLERIRAIVWNS